MFCFVRSYQWLQPRIVISDPDVLKQIFIKEASTFRDRQVHFSIWLSDIDLAVCSLTTHTHLTFRECSTK